MGKGKPDENLHLSLENKLDGWMLNRAPVPVKYMTDTGKEMDKCLKLGCLPMGVHFYLPVLDIADLENRRVWERKSDLSGIDL